LEGLRVELDGLELFFEVLVFLFEDEALVFEEGEFGGEFLVVPFAFDVDIDVTVGLLSQDEVFAHAFKHTHEGAQKVVLLFYLELRVEFVEFSDGTQNAVMEVT
jgi:hypothetical protein